jgi:hypothetical protein
VCVDACVCACCALQKIGLHAEVHTKAWARGSSVNAGAAGEEPHTSAVRVTSEGDNNNDDETPVTVRPSYVNDHTDSVPAVGATPYRRRNSQERAKELVEEGVIDASAATAYVSIPSPLWSWHVFDSLMFQVSSLLHPWRRFHSVLLRHSHHVFTSRCHHHLMNRYIEGQEQMDALRSGSETQPEAVSPNPAFSPSGADDGASGAAPINDAPAQQPASSR